MTDLEKIIKAWERCKICDMRPIAPEEGLKAYLECEYTIGKYCGQDKLIHETLKLLKEQEDKPVLDEFGKCFLNALKRQLDMKLTMIELLITPEFAEKIVELIEKMFD